MNVLYPLKFSPIIKDKIWGGERLKNELNKEASEKAGESWELSGVQDNLSVVSNGFLAGNNLQELIEIYMGDLVGDDVYKKYGIEFPLLIKFIDANDILSVQVHPDDELSKKRHNAYGKTEMWYIIKAEEGAELISGFNQEMDKETYVKHLEAGTLKEILNFEKVSEGDVFFMPAGRVHAIGAGVLLAEIQQTSDVTYRIYDWDRPGDDGKPRELHTELALDAIDYKYYKDYRTTYDRVKNQASNAVDCPYFTTNVIEFDRSVEKDFNFIDSFVVYMCTEGAAVIKYGDGNEETITAGETVLIPATLKVIEIVPVTPSKLLEVYIK
mgnify:CR=1 FL=1